MKLGIIVDSSTGMTKKEVEDKGWGFLPLHVFIDGVDYSDGINITTKEVYEKLTLKSEVRTSASSPAEILDVFEHMSKKYDQVIVYALSSHLSSQTDNLAMFSKDFENISVIDSHGLSHIIVAECERAEKLAKEGKNLQEILLNLEKNRDGFAGLLVPHTLDWLVKGGRINSAVASMASMLKIVPIISFNEGFLDKHGKGRTFNKTLIKSIKSIMSTYKNREYDLYILHVNNLDITKHIEKINSISGKKIKITPFPSTIALHVGLGAVGVLAILKKY